ncbi:MAG: alpha/beta hydrolase, partial [Phreatobacter sp.]|nr:alpha/beta hydrolase [Phreatobacter sp.]
MADMARRPALTDIGAGPALVFLHGWSVDRSFFAAQEALAAAGFRIVVPDLPGHGERDIGATPPTIAGLADDLSALLSELRLEAATLIGWSMGATVALDVLAHRGTAGIAGLVIVDMTPKVPNAPDWPYGLSSGQDMADAMDAAGRMEGDWSRYAPRIARAMFSPGRMEDDPLIHRAAERIAARDPEVMAPIWRSLVAADHRSTVENLPVPVLAVAGAESQLYRPDVARWIASHAPDGHAIEIAGAGHAPHLEQPAAFNAALAA